MKNLLPALGSKEWGDNRRSIVIYAIAALLCLVILVVVMQLYRADLRLPLTYGGDVMFYHIIVKGMIEQGWFTRIDYIGFPAGMDLRDIPTSDHNFYLLQLKLLSLFTSNYALINNLFYLLSFPLTTISALYVFRRFGISNSPATLCSLLFTFLPYHFMRGQHHLFLSSYYLVPLMVMVILWCVSEELKLIDEENGRRLKLLQPKLIISIIICILMASTGTYYAFFGCFLLLIAGGIAAMRDRKLKPLVVPLTLIAIILSVTVINLLPSISYLYQNGDTPIVRRNIADADIYGLRIAQLLLPVSHHRSYRVATFKGVFNQRPYINENDDASLGIIGSCGFLLLIGLIFYRWRYDEQPAMNNFAALFNNLSLLNLAGLLIATIGGFGALFAFLVSPKIRAYNRISIFIAFFALFAVAISLEFIYRRYINTNARKIFFFVLIVTAALIGILDQTTKRYIPDYDQIKSEFSNDHEFVKRIESSMAENSAIFQLPLMSFPENPKINQMKDYDPARGYLHSSKLKWSYGAVKNREGEVRQKMMTAKPSNEMVEALCLTGYSGLWVDRFGYSDKGAKLEGELTSLLAISPIVSNDGRLVFFDLKSSCQKLRDSMAEADWEAKRGDTVNSLLALWQDGFSDEERDEKDYWRWCAENGRMEIINNSRQPKNVTLEMSFSAGRDANLAIESDLFNDRLKINFAGVPFSRTVTITPGRHVLRFSTDAPRILTPQDSRIIHFCLLNFKIKSAAMANSARQ